jgi:hypothetical protein
MPSRILTKLALVLVFCFTAARAEDPVPIPELKHWEANMLKFGEAHKDERSFGIMPEQFVYYYDGEWVYFQIADYTGNPKFIEYAHNCQETYRGHVFAENGKLPGHRIHSHGLYEDYKRFKDEKSKEALMLLVTMPIWAPGHPIDGGAPDSGACREDAYMLMTMLDVEKLGVKMPRIEHGVKCGLTCLDQFAVSKTAKVIQPFMTGLLAEALIQYAEQHSADGQIVPPLVVFADWLWDHCWVAKDSAFCYLRENPNDPATVQKDGTADLNLLIAPMYAWLYKKTGEVRFRERGDQAFAGGVKGAWLEKGKCFSQNYRWSFSYVKWRREGPEKNAVSSPSKTTDTSAKPSIAVAKSDPAAPATPATPVIPSAPALDPAIYRAAIEANLKKNARIKKGDKIMVQSFKQELGVGSITENGVGVLVDTNEMPLRWKDLSNEDILCLAALYCTDTDGLFNGGALATALKLTKQREKFISRLSEVNSPKAGELEKLK